MSIFSRLFARTPAHHESSYDFVYSAVVARLSRPGVTVGKTSHYPRVEVHSITEGERLDKLESLGIDPDDLEELEFLDAAESPDRYDGKTVRFTAMLHREKGTPKDSFIPGRMAMNCCEADMVFLGYLCHSPEASRFASKSWVSLTAKVKKEFVKQYGEEGPVLYAEKLEPAKPIKDPVTFT